MNFKYFMPVKVYFGENVVIEHSEEFKSAGRRALIVTGRRSSKINGSLNDVEKALDMAEIKYFLFDEVEENPSLETIEKAAEFGIHNSVDFVIGVGGGSPMDAAKAIAIFIKNPHINKDNIFSQSALNYIPVFEVATTSGTGSEVTPYSIVTVRSEKTKKNLGQKVYPSAAFLDSKYTLDLPYNITVNTAIDAFTHLVEGYLNTNSTYMSDIYGEKGFYIFKECFDSLVRKDLTGDFREKIMLASTLAGIQIAQNGTSLPHGMGYALTYFKGLPHGLANGVLTIEYLKCFKNKEKIEKMLGILGLNKIDDLKEIFNKLFDVNIEITEGEIKEYSIVFYSNKSKLKNHPEDLKLEDIERIYMKSLL